MPNRSRNAFFAALIIVVVVSFVWFRFRTRDTSPPFVSPFSPTVTPSPVPKPTVASAAAAAVTPTPAPTAEAEVANVGLAVRDYRAAFGTNPIGNNAEITRALLGENPRQAAFLVRAEVTLNADGELLDRWGHPYFFHSVTNRLMEVRSAGPDGQMYTADDVISE
jgi:hypothetical protein